MKIHVMLAAGILLTACAEWPGTGGSAAQSRAEPATVLVGLGPPAIGARYGIEGVPSSSYRATAAARHVPAFYIEFGPDQDEMTLMPMEESFTHPQRASPSSSCSLESAYLDTFPSGAR